MEPARGQPGSGGRLSRDARLALTGVPAVPFFRRSHEPKCSPHWRPIRDRRARRCAARACATCYAKGVIPIGLKDSLKQSAREPANEDSPPAAKKRKGVVSISLFARPVWPFRLLRSQVLGCSASKLPNAHIGDGVPCQSRRVALPSRDKIQNNPVRLERSLRRTIQERAVE